MRDVLTRWTAGIAIAIVVSLTILTYSNVVQLSAVPKQQVSTEVIGPGGEVTVVTTIRLPKQDKDAWFDTHDEAILEAERRMSR